MGTKCFFPGGISDSHYIIKSGIFEEQNEFAQNDTTDDDIVPFFN